MSIIIAIIKHNIRCGWQINLPRASGTCTRVPTEVRLRQENKDWRCAVKIRWETDDSSHDKVRIICLARSTYTTAGIVADKAE